jgi:hypothetical protein
MWVASRAGAARRYVWPRLIWLAASAVVAVGLFTAYLCQSRTQAVNADGASNAMQAWDMLHGNVLLRGWRVSDVSFYTTELPQYALVEAARGLGSDVVHVCAAMTYTLLVLLAAWLAKGRRDDREGVMRALIAAGIMLAPSLGDASYTLLLSPDHVGTGVPLLVTFIIADRAGPGRWRRYAPFAVCLVLAWGAVGDPLVGVIGAVPLAAVCAMRVFQGLALRRDPFRERAYELWLAIAALLSVGVAYGAVKAIAAAGGWTATAVRTTIASGSMVSGNGWLTLRGVLELFGADFIDARPGLAVFFAAVHLAGLALVACGLWLAVRGFFGSELLVQVLLVAIVVNLAAYAAGTQVQNIHSTREIAAVLPFGAVLAGRQLAGRQPAGRRLAGRRLAGVALLAGYAAMLGFGASQPSVPADNADLTAWLGAHGLRHGLSGYWQGSSVTLDSGNSITLRSVVVNGDTLMSQAYWEAKQEWYEPSSNYANFLVTASAPHEEVDPALEWRMTALAGRPAHVYEFGRYTIAVWNRNLLAALG